jgi:hypothetical protein
MAVIPIFGIGITFGLAMGYPPGFRGGSYQPNLRDKAAAAAPTILRPALQEIRGWQRLQRFAAAAYPTIAPAG